MLNEMELSQALKQSIDNDFDGFELHYQPQFCAQTSNIKGLEALIRWNLPDIGFIGPDIFIPLAERKGMIEVIGTWVIDSACKTLRLIHDTTDLDLHMSINVSGIQLHNPNFLSILCESVDRYQINYQDLIIEVTETAFMEHDSRANETLADVRDAGFGVSIDDFGTGHASLEYIQRFNPSELKIDREFIDKFLEDPHCLMIVKFTLSLVRNMKIRAVAEGIETQAQADHLKTLGTPILQGYLLGKPESLANLQKTHLKPKQEN